KPAHLARYYLFLQNFSRPQAPFFPESWSLAVEEWFYLTTPIMLLLLHALAGRWCQKQTVCWALVAINLILVTGYRYAKAAALTNDDPVFWDKVFRTIVLTRLDSIMFGVIGAIVKYYHATLWKKYTRILLWLGLALLLLVQCYAGYSRFVQNEC